MKNSPALTSLRYGAAQAPRSVVDIENVTTPNAVGEVEETIQ